MYFCHLHRCALKANPKGGHYCQPCWRGAPAFPLSHAARSALENAEIITLMSGRQALRFTSHLAREVYLEAYQVIKAAGGAWNGGSPRPDSKDPGHHTFGYGVDARGSVMHAMGTCRLTESEHPYCIDPSIIERAAETIRQTAAGTAAQGTAIEGATETVTVGKWLLDGLHALIDRQRNAMEIERRLATADAEQMARLKDLITAAHAEIDQLKSAAARDVRTDDKREATRLAGTIQKLEAEIDKLNAALLSADVLRDRLLNREQGVNTALGMPARAHQHEVIARIHELRRVNGGTGV